MAAVTVRERCLIAGLCLAMLSGCKSVPVAVATPPPLPPIPLDTRVAWLLRLEHQRILRDPAESAPSEAPASGPVSLRPARTPDLQALLTDVDPAVRGRAALAIGRVGRAEGLPALVSALSDADDGVRANAAFALGLVGAEAAIGPLETALKDASIAVRSRAAEGLGLIGQPAAAAGLAEASAGCRNQLGLQPDDDTSAPSAETNFCRLAIFALVRLKQYEPLARVVLDEQGQPVSRWWPVAFALQRIGDKRAVPALLTLANTDGVYTPAFALRGLAAAGEAGAAPIARAIAARATADVRLRIAAVRALGQIGGAGAAQALRDLLGGKDTPPALVIEAVTALGDLGTPTVFDTLLDLLTDPSPSIRAAALIAAAKANPDTFLPVAAGLPVDRDWSVRAALTTVLSTFPPDQVRNGLADLTKDQDARVVGPALRALAKVGAPDLAARLYAALESEDFVVRATAAELLGDLRPADGLARLIAAYGRGGSDAAYTARAAALASIARYSTDEARAALRGALDDKAWPVRWRAAELLRAAGDVSAVLGPAPLRQPAAFFESAEMLHPAFSPHAFIETRRGTVEFELDLVNAPVTSLAFMQLARSGFFNGLKMHRVVPNFVVQMGDPRGDGEGGPGFSLMDELSPVPYVRGTVGMALDWRDTGGSQFFITVSPQPHLDAKYTVFGHVVRGAEVLDQLVPWDVIERVRIWDGASFQ